MELALSLYDYDYHNMSSNVATVKVTVGSVYWN